MFIPLLSMEEIGYFIFMEEEEAKQQNVNVECNDDFVGEEATPNDYEE